MVRPRKKRRLSKKPTKAIYKPAGIPLDDLQQILLRPDELEALRLADLNNFTQAKAAAQMCISRSTFQRILSRARRQVAFALVNQQALSLEEYKEVCSSLRIQKPQ